MCAKVAVAMSGGVDSSTAAWILKQADHDLIGVTMKLFDNGDVGVEGESSCCSLDDVEDARAPMSRGRPPTPASTATDTLSSAPCSSGRKSWTGTMWPRGTMSA